MILTRFCSEFLNASIWQNFLTELLRNWAFVYKINKVYWHKKSEAITEKENVLTLDKKASNRFLLTLKSPFDIFLAAKQQKNFSHSLVKTLPMSQVCGSLGHKNVPSHNKIFRTEPFLFNQMLELLCPWKILFDQMWLIVIHWPPPQFPPPPPSSQESHQNQL